MARIFDNDTSGFTAADKGKYYNDSDGNGAKGTCDTGGAGNECLVDVWYNIAEGSLKGTYTPLTSIGGSKLNVKPLTKAPVVFTALHDYVDAGTFKTQVDNSMAGQMRDCAECHVGGGAMEYVPNPQGDNLVVTARNDLRTDPGAMLGGFDTFSYYIDQYDEDGDGILGEVLAQSYADTGVLEVDCLMCHMTDYSWADRTTAIRKGNFDASRVAGAGLGTADNATGALYGTAGYGKQVTYDTALMVEDDGTGNARLSLNALNLIVATPPNANCASCHFDLHQVDWKKRGTSWTATMSHETEVHGSIGCMGCHTRDDGVDMNAANNSIWSGSAKPGTTGADVLGHDPSKGNAPYSSLWNANDNNVRTCAGCHVASAGASYLGVFGAPDPTARHDAMGLTKTLVQSAGMGKMTGVANASHLDIMACEACHTRKLGRGPSVAEGGSTHGSLYEWGTGGAMVDSTGPDAAGRLTDHENLYVERTMENNLTLAWQGGKLGPRNALVTMFWRDKHDRFNYGHTGTYVDINADGQDGAMDAVNPSHVRNVMAAAGLDVLTHDGTMTGAEMGAQRSALMANLLAEGGIDPTGAKLKLSFMGVMFKANHGTSPAVNAWGSGGCKDCHGADKGFYNGAYDLKPRDLTASWTNNLGSNDVSAVGGGKPKWDYVVPFTKVNKNNYSGRDVTLPICSTYYGPSARPAAPVVGLLTDIGNACDGPDGLPTTADDGVWTVYPLGDIKADWQFTDFHPTLWAKGQTGRTIAVAAAYGNTNTVRTMDRSEALWETSFVAGSYDGTITGTDGTPYTTRADWVNYLNGRGNYRPTIHVEHVDHQLMSCSDCHYGGTSDVDTPVASGYAVVADPTKAFADGTPLALFEYTPNPITGYGTCATQCHTTGSGGSTQSEVAIARISAVHSPSENFAVNLSGEKSACFSVDTTTGAPVLVPGTKTYTWTIPATATTDTCTGNDVADCNVTWDSAGPRDVQLDMGCSVGPASDTVIFPVTAFDVGGGDNPNPNLAASVAGSVVTVTQATMSAEVADVQILWGDYSEKTVINATTVPDLATFLASGVTHTYASAGTYEITVVTTNDGDPNNKRFTYTLSVTVL